MEGWRIRQSLTAACNLIVVRLSVQLAGFAVFLVLYGLTAESQCSWQLQLITRAKGPGANSTDASIDSPTQHSPQPEPQLGLIVNSALTNRS
jgi:hypothetical protein